MCALSFTINKTSTQCRLLYLVNISQRAFGFFFKSSFVKNIDALSLISQNVDALFREAL